MIVLPQNNRVHPKNSHETSENGGGDLCEKDIFEKSTVVGKCSHGH